MDVLEMWCEEVEQRMMILRDHAVDRTLRGRAAHFIKGQMDEIGEEDAAQLAKKLQLFMESGDDPTTEIRRTIWSLEATLEKLKRQANKSE